MGVKENKFKTRDGWEAERVRLGFGEGDDERLIKIAACQELLMIWKKH